MKSTSGVRRRSLLLGTAAWPAALRAAPGTAGPVQPPLPAADVRLTAARDRPLELRQMLLGRVTALQLMFTGCTATCPIQGAIFSEVQTRLAGAPARVRLLSVSIDPLGDDSRALRQWLARFGAEPQRWSAAIAPLNGVDRLVDFLKGRAAGPDRHTAQAYLFDTQARLVYRTLDMPPADHLAKLMRELDSRA